jgi:hypothetical protein
MLGGRHDYVPTKALDCLDYIAVIGSHDDFGCPLDQQSSLVNVLDEELSRFAKDHFLGKSGAVQPRRDDDEDATAHA